MARAATYLLHAPTRKARGQSMPRRRSSGPLPRTARRAVRRCAGRRRRRGSPRRLRAWRALEPERFRARGSLTTRSGPDIPRRVSAMDHRRGRGSSTRAQTSTQSRQRRAITSRGRRSALGRYRRTLRFRGTEDVEDGRMPISDARSRVAARRVMRVANMNRSRPRDARGEPADRGRSSRPCSGSRRCPTGGGSAVAVLRDVTDGKARDPLMVERGMLSTITACRRGRSRRRQRQRVGVERSA